MSETYNNNYSSLKNEKGHYSSGCHCFLFCLLLVPNIIDCILTIKGYSSNATAYFVLRFILLFVNIFYYAIFYAFFIYIYRMIKGPSAVMALGPILIPYLIILLIVFLIEIPIIVLFIIYYKDILLFAKIGFFCHLFYIPLNVCMLIISFYNQP